MVDLLSFLFVATEPTGLGLVKYISLITFQNWSGLVSFSVSKFWCFCFPDLIVATIPKLFVAWPVLLRIWFSDFPDLPVLIIHFLFQSSGQPFIWLSFNVFLYCWRMTIKNFGYFCVEIFKRFIDIRCLFNQFPVDVFYITAQVSMVIMFIFTTYDCSYIIFDGVDFFT